MAYRCKKERTLNLFPADGYFSILLILTPDDLTCQWKSYWKVI